MRKVLFSRIKKLKDPLGTTRSWGKYPPLETEDRLQEWFSLKKFS
jgi:hypothetical protein